VVAVLYFVIDPVIVGGIAVTGIIGAISFCMWYYEKVRKEREEKDGNKGIDVPLPPPRQLTKEEQDALFKKSMEQFERVKQIRVDAKKISEARRKTEEMLNNPTLWDAIKKSREDNDDNNQ
jgi:hypothetical protein